MKKILFTVLLAADLFAMDPNVVFDIARSENPIEAQVNNLYEIGDIETAWRDYEIKNEKDSNSEECKKAKEKYDKLIQDIRACSPLELKLVSRESESEIEKDAVEKLKKALSLGANTTVRIIDAESYIKGLYLSQSEKDQLIKALSSDEELERQVEIFCESYRFVNTSRKLRKSFFTRDIMLPGGLKIPDNLKDNPKLKDTIRSHMIEESKKSQVYREAMVSYMARSKAFNFLSDYCYAPNRFKSKLIIKGKEPMFYNFSGSIFYLDKIYYYHSMVNEKDSINESKLRLFDIRPSLAFFHEVGHSLDFFSKVNDYVGLDQTGAIGPKLLGIDTDQDKFEQDRHLYLKILKKNMIQAFSLRNKITGEKGGVLRFLVYYLKNLFKKDEEINGLLDSLKSNLDNPYFLTKLFMDNSTEVWQIFGIFYNGDTLYINKMSDFALYCNLGLPIRKDHIIFYNRNSKVFCLDKRSLPYDVYSALMEINGTTMDAYLQKIHGKK